MNFSSPMESKAVTLKPGVVAWVCECHQLGAIPKGLVNTMKVTVVAVNKKDRSAVVRRGDGMLFTISPHLLDAGHIHRFEGERGWRSDSDLEVLAVHEATLYMYRAESVQDGVQFSHAKSIEHLEWVILRNGGSFYADDEGKHRLPDEAPVWVVR